jgi:hypothetical protein
MLAMDPFDTLFRLQRALETRLDSDWLNGATAGIGGFPAINLFQQGRTSSPWWRFLASLPVTSR